MQQSVVVYVPSGFQRIFCLNLLFLKKHFQPAAQNAPLVTVLNLGQASVP